MKSNRRRARQVRGASVWPKDSSPFFAQEFPRITYTLMWDSQLINAQAWRLGEQRNVYLYGGLVRHRAITGRLKELSQAVSKGAVRSKAALRPYPL